MQLLKALRAPVKTLRFIAKHPIGSQAMHRSVLDWLRWQVSSRLAFGPLLVPFVDDTSLLVERGMTGATGNVYCGLHEAEEMAFVLHFLRESDVFVDIGANVGTFTVLAAGAVGARTHTFEPIPSTFAKLMRNVRFNRLEQLVDAHCAALGAESGEVLMTSGFDTTNRILEGAEAQAAQGLVKVPIKPLDEVLGGRGAALIKIDVEGHSDGVLAGATRALASPDTAALIVELFGPKETNATLRMLQSLGYTPIEYQPLTRQVVPQQKLGHGNNTIFVRDVEKVRERVQDARKFRVKSFLV